MTITPSLLLEQVVLGRRSVRRFLPRPVPDRLVEELVALAAAAPAPHHSRPWRFLVLSSAARERLVMAMEGAWLRDLQADGHRPEDAGGLLERSRRRILSAPVLLLACLELSGARPWPDERRRRAERDMFVQSLGAALQNLMLAAHARGLGSCLMGAPLFCQDEVRAALGLPEGWEPAFLVELGYPDPDYRPRPRPPLDLSSLLQRA
ncbi:MAG TPA: nitroreductase family protein [Dehalococcoidia bacterium]|nr:nitroreductase family protein [Dehalococcoidia bacterium]